MVLLLLRKRYFFSLNLVSNDVAEGWRGVEVVAIGLLQLYRAWLGVCRAMYAAWSRLTSVRLLLIADTIPKA